jgi:hypothetical protein
MNKKQKYSPTLTNYHKYLCKAFSLFSIASLTSIIVISVVYLSSIERSQQVIAQSSEDSEDTESFVAQGQIDSIIYTTSGKWNAQGKWAMTISEGTLTSFNTDMAWNNGTAGHSHEFRNFEADDAIELGTDGSVSIEGEMDVGTNRAVSWQNVPAGISIEKGKIISISLDDEETNNHFGDQAVHGTVTLIKPCNMTPGPNMEVPTDCT